MQEQFFSIPGDILCSDTWPLTLVRGTAMLAYKELDSSGQISLTYPVVMHPDRIEIRYMAPIPHEWVLASLKQTEERIRETLAVEQDTLALRIEDLVASANIDTLSTFGELAQQYKQLHKLLQN